jgi:trans-aconitate methyltransferase
MNKYIWDAEDYANYSRSQQQWGRELIKKLNISGDESILDIGCGDGKITAEIANLVPDGIVIGIDSSQEMISLAAQKYPKCEHPNLHFKLLAAADIDYQGIFEIVFSNAVFHWIQDHEHLLKKIHAALKPGGRVLLQMGGKGNAAGIIDVLSEVINSGAWKNYFKDFSIPYYFYSPENYEEWIHHTGFIKSRTELIPKEMIHASRDEFKGWIRTTWLPYLKQIPDKLRTLFIDDLVDNYLKRYPEFENGTIKVKMVRLEIDLVKPNH